MRSPELVWTMWLPVFFIFYQPVNSGMCSTASCSAAYVCRTWPYLYQFWELTEKSMMQCNVADTSKTEYYKQCINIRFLMQCEGMIYSEQKVLLQLYCICQEPLRLNCHVSLQTRSGTYTRLYKYVERPFFTFVVTRINTRNVFYNRHSEYANSPQQVWAEYRSRYSDWLRAGQSGDQISAGARFSAPVQTGLGAHPASCTMVPRSFPGIKRPGRSVDHPPTPPNLAPMLKKE
jgi:hypothetical protein